MSEDILARAFEPFFTTKEIGKGTGLGLSMVPGFVRQSGGDASIESAPSVGTSVSLWLPAAVPAPISTSIIPGNEMPATQIGPKRILVVDDEGVVCQTVSLFLRKAGFEPVVAATAEEALALLKEDGPFDLMVTDQSMAGMSGTDLIGEVALFRSDLPTMIMTGYDRVSGIERLGGRVTVLTKLFQRSMFISQVQALLRTAQHAGPVQTDTSPKAAGVPRAAGAVDPPS